MGKAQISKDQLCIFDFLLQVETEGIETKEIDTSAKYKIGDVVYMVIADIIEKEVVREIILLKRKEKPCFSYTVYSSILNSFKSFKDNEETVFDSKEEAQQYLAQNKKAITKLENYVLDKQRTFVGCDILTNHTVNATIGYISPTIILFSDYYQYLFAYEFATENEADKFYKKGIDKITENLNEQKYYCYAELKNLQRENKALYKCDNNRWAELTYYLKNNDYLIR